jgi:hypothetical protein
MLLRPGNAGPDTFADHAAVLTAAIRQIPSRMRSKLLVRVDGAGASHELITHLLSLTTKRRTVLFTFGWMITDTDEQAIRLLPAAAWQAAVDQNGAVQEDKHVAEITHLLSRAAGWPTGLRWIVRRTKPSRRQARNLTAFERATGWRYSIIVTNIPGTQQPRTHPPYSTPLPRPARLPPRSGETSVSITNHVIRGKTGSAVEPASLCASSRASAATGNVCPVAPRRSRLRARQRSRDVSRGTGARQPSSLGERIA